MDIKCPFCGGLMESEVEVAVGQQIECPYCGRVFAYARSKDVPTRIPLPSEAARSRSYCNEKCGSLFQRLIAPWQKCHWTALADAPWQLQIVAIMIVLMLLSVIRYDSNFFWAVSEVVVATGVFVPLLIYSSRTRLLVIVLSTIGAVSSLIDGEVDEGVGILIVFICLLLSKPCMIWYRQHRVAQSDYGVADVVRKVRGNLREKPIAIILILVFLVLCMRLVIVTAKLVHKGMEDVVLSEERVREPSIRLSELKSWYRQQLNYHGVKELSFQSRLDKKYGNSYYLTLDDGSSGLEEIRLENMQYFSWPKSMVKGFAEKLIRTRIEILNLEDPDANVKDVFYMNGVKD